MSLAWHNVALIALMTLAACSKPPVIDRDRCAASRACYAADAVGCCSEELRWRVSVCAECPPGTIGAAECSGRGCAPPCGETGAAVGPLTASAEYHVLPAPPRRFYPAPMSACYALTPRGECDPSRATPNVCGACPEGTSSCAPDAEVYPYEPRPDAGMPGPLGRCAFEDTARGPVVHPDVSEAWCHAECTRLLATLPAGAYAFDCTWEEPGMAAVVERRPPCPASGVGVGIGLPAGTRCFVDVGSACCGAPAGTASSCGCPAGTLPESACGSSETAGCPAACDATAGTCGVCETLGENGAVTQLPRRSRAECESICASQYALSPTPLIACTWTAMDGSVTTIPR